MLGNAYTAAVFILRRMLENTFEQQNKLYHMFVDLEQVYSPQKGNRVGSLRQKAPEKLVQIVRWARH